MGRRVRPMIAALLAVIALSMTVTPALAVKREQYNSTVSFAIDRMGTCRPYHGTAIHIQLTTFVSNGNQGDSGTYTISVYRCSNHQATTLVGGAGSCHYWGFCGLGWTINLGGSEYAFYFKKIAGDGHDIVTSDSVQMWSTS
jgi:hypothetical protein